MSETDTARVRNVADLVSAAAARRGGAPALRSGERTVDWAELDARVDAFARGLGGLGLRAGDRVGLVLANSVEFAVAYFGTLRAGLVAVPTNPGYTAQEMAFQLTDAGCALVVCDPARAGTVRAALDGPATPLLAVTGPSTPAGATSYESLLTGDGTPPDPGRGGDDLAVLLYTSGTSGRPKGAMLTHRALLANLDQLATVRPEVVAADDVVLLVLPLFHVYGLNAGLGMVARAGACGLLLDRFQPVETLTAVRDRGVTNVLGAPPMYVAWSLLPETAQALSGVRLAVCGAAPLPVAAAEAMAAATGRRVHEGYGLTEAAPVVTTTLCSADPAAGSVGRPLPGVEVRLVDHGGVEPEPGDPGEVWIRGDNLFSGYWPDGHDGPQDDGWFATGDIAYADPAGDLHLVDRLRDLVIVSGFNVYPREVEAVLAEHPDVAEVAVVGVPHPYTGETVKAYVVARPGSDLSADDVIEHAARSLARFKCPTVVAFVAELPRAVAGKVARGVLRGEPPEALR